MTLKLLIDMNLPPAWEPWLTERGWEAVHWSTVGDPRAKDREIMAWARANGRIVFTHDLDFGTLLALSHASGPSVLQVRTEHVMPDQLGNTMIATLNQHEADLSSGALVVWTPNEAGSEFCPSELTKQVLPHSRGLLGLSSEARIPASSAPQATAGRRDCRPTTLWT